MGVYVPFDSLVAAFCTALHGLTFLVTLATVITAAAPMRWRTRGFLRLFRLLNLLAGNVGQNRNADDG